MSIIKILKKFKNKKKVILFNKTTYLNSFFLNKKIKIYNGKCFNNLFIIKNKLFNPVGEFLLTRKSPMNFKRWGKKNLK